MYTDFDKVSSCDIKKQTLQEPQKYVQNMKSIESCENPLSFVINGI